MTYWTVPASPVRALPDYGHPLTERFAMDLHTYTPGPPRPVWEHETVEQREVFRERARRLMAGDTSMIPWTYALGWMGRRDVGR